MYVCVQNASVLKYARVYICAGWFAAAQGANWCSDILTCQNLHDNGVTFICDLAFGECGIKQNDNVRMVLRMCLSMIPSLFGFLAAGALIAYPKQARSEEAHTKVIAAIARVKQGEIVEDPPAQCPTCRRRGLRSLWGHWLQPIIAPFLPWGRSLGACAGSIGLQPRSKVRVGDWAARSVKHMQALHLDSSRLQLVGRSVCVSQSFPGSTYGRQSGNRSVPCGPCSGATRKP